GLVRLARGGWWFGADLDHLDAGQIDPDAARAIADESKLDASAAGAASNDPGCVDVDGPGSPHPASAASPAGRHGGGDVEGEQLAEGPPERVAVESRLRCHELPPVGPNCSVFT